MSDYAALAQRVAAGVPGIRGCLLLSRDGMVLGAYPEGPSEAQVKAAWLRLVAVGEPDRASIEFLDQTWAFVRRGGYAAFVVADVGVRPGVVLDLLEQVLMAGETERVHDREAMRLPEAPVAPSGKPRTILHKPDRVPVPPPQPVATKGSPIAQELPVVGPAETAPQDAPANLEGDVADGDPSPETELPPTDADDDSEVDRILLAKEFAGLLQVPKDDDEATK